MTQKHIQDTTLVPKNCKSFEDHMKKIFKNISQYRIDRNLGMSSSTLRHIIKDLENAEKFQSKLIIHWCTRHG